MERLLSLPTSIQAPIPCQSRDNGRSPFRENLRSNSKGNLDTAFEERCGERRWRRSFSLQFQSRSSEWRDEAHAATLEGMMQRTTVGDRVEYLDGLRGLACLQVVLLHTVSAYFPDFTQGTPGSLGSAVRHSPAFLIYNGWLAVFLFFVLSGYVLTNAYDRPGDTLRRIEARIVRLWVPAAAFGAMAAAMYLLFPLAHLWLADLNGSGFLKACWNVGPGWLPILRDVFVYPIFTGYQNGLVPTTIPGTVNFFVSSGAVLNSPVWSLSVEIYGSLLVMWLVFSRERHFAFWLISMGVASLASPMLACFVAGHLAAVTKVAEARRSFLAGAVGAVARAAIFASCVYLTRDPSNEPRLFAGAVLIFLAVTDSPSARRLLSSKMCLALGRRSVTIYLTHWAFIFGFGSWVLVSLDPTVPWQTARLFVAPAVIFIVLAVSGPLSVVDKVAVTLSRQVGRGQFAWPILHSRLLALIGRRGADPEAVSKASIG
jgi:peptidoglycan/LPS O-acetylase OafA/YrhL